MEFLFFQFFFIINKASMTSYTYKHLWIFQKNQFLEMELRTPKNYLFWILIAISELSS